jgi:hypothetical protein
MSLVEAVSLVGRAMTTTDWLRVVCGFVLFCYGCLRPWLSRWTRGRE